MRAWHPLLKPDTMKYYYFQLPRWWMVPRASKTDVAKTAERRRGEIVAEPVWMTHCTQEAEPTVQASA